MSGHDLVWMVVIMVLAFVFSVVTGGPPPRG